MMIEILIMMMFLAIVDDFYLQPIVLANLKQKSFWRQHAPDKLYAADYLMALLIHGFSWTVMMIAPLWYYDQLPFGWWFLSIIVVNMLFHAYIDHQKANRKRFSLWHDQMYHMIQIGLTWWAFTPGEMATAKTYWSVSILTMGLIVIGLEAVWWRKGRSNVAVVNAP